MSGSRVTASFVLYNTSETELAGALASVLGSERVVQVCLVDNSPAPCVDPPSDPRVLYVHSGENLGYGRGHNLALRHLRVADYHAILNTDLVFAPEVIEQLVDYLDADSTAGVVSPRIVYEDGQPQPLCRLLPDPRDMAARTLFSRTNWGKQRNERYEFRGWHYDSVAEFPFLSGCFMLARRALLDAVSGFDESFFLYFEDTDLSRRLQAKSRAVYVPTAPVTHLYRSRRGFSYRATRAKLRSAIRYFNKWGWLFDAERDRVNARALAQFTPPPSAGNNRAG